MEKFAKKWHITIDIWKFVVYNNSTINEQVFGYNFNEGGTEDACSQTRHRGRNILVCKCVH